MFLLLGWITTSVNCSNVVSTASTNVTYYMEEQILGLSVTPSTFIDSLYQPVVFTLDRTFGTNVTYAVDFDDGTPVQEFYTGPGQNYTVVCQHSYAIQVL